MDTLIQGKFTIEEAMSDRQWKEWFDEMAKQRDRIEALERLLESEKWSLGNISSAEPFIHLSSAYTAEQQNHELGGQPEGVNMETDEKKYGIAPCHFCGTSGLVFNYLEERDVFYVCCGECGASGPWHKTEEGATALWNRPNTSCSRRRSSAHQVMEESEITADMAREAIARQSNEAEVATVFRLHILRFWPRERIENFCLHLLGINEQKYREWRQAVERSVYTTGEDKTGHGD